jgi:hypothetical protein
MPVDSDLHAVVGELARSGIRWDEHHRMKGSCPNGHKVNAATGTVAGTEIRYSSLFVRDSTDRLIMKSSGTSSDRIVSKKSRQASAPGLFGGIALSILHYRGRQSTTFSAAQSVCLCGGDSGCHAWRHVESSFQDLPP